MAAGPGDAAGEIRVVPYTSRRHEMAAANQLTIRSAFPPVVLLWDVQLASEVGDVVRAA